MNEKDFAETATRYRRFAEKEARGRSPLYEKFACCIAHDRELLKFLVELPGEKRQPNLLLAAVRHLFGTPGEWSQFRELLKSEWAAVRTIMLERSTQTNEPARCAALLPLLVRLPQPLALLEVGASAGLCLLPDLYAYDYGKGILWSERTDYQVPLFRCKVNEEAPVPTRMPDIVWRAGLDLNPLDVLIHAGPATTALGELTRVTKPGGRIGVIDWMPFFVLSTTRPVLAESFNTIFRKAVYDYNVSANLARHLHSVGLSGVRVKGFLAHTDNLDAHPFWRAFIVQQAPMFVHAGLIDEGTSHDLLSDLERLNANGEFSASFIVQAAVGTKLYRRLFSTAIFKS